MKKCRKTIKPLLELMRCESRGNRIAEGLALGLVTGMMIGGLAGVLFAPYKGSKTRKKTKKKLLKAKNRVEEGIKESGIMISEKANEKKEAVTDYFSDGADLVKGKADRIKQSLGDIKGSAEEGVEDIMEKVEDQVEENVEKAVDMKNKVGKAGTAAKKELKK